MARDRSDRRDRDDDDRDPPQPKKPADKKPAAVIELNGNAGLSAGESVLYRLLPAAVVSAGLHLIVAVIAFVCTLVFTRTATAEAGPSFDAAVEDRTDQPKDANLTTVEETVDTERGALTVENVPLDTITVESKNLAETEPVGNPTGNLQNPLDSLNTAGSMSDLTATTVGNQAVGQNVGMSGAGDNGLATVNESMQGRRGATKDKLLKTGGGNDASEAAVARGLAWLARVQKKDGSWQYDNGGGDPAAATGMGLLPFLAAGQTHKGTASKDNKYKDTVDRAIKALLAIQASRKDGSLSANMYAHAIGAVALCEAFGMSGDKPLLRGPCQAAIDYIQKAQGPNGSWGYKAGDDGDTSIVGWQVQALHSAKMCKDLKVDTKVLEKAMTFLDAVASGSSKFKYGYSNPGTFRPSLTAVGLLCRYYLNGWGPNSAGFKDGVNYLLKEHPPAADKEFDMYYYYYATQVAHLHEGDAWQNDWNPKMRDMLIEKQVKEKAKPTVDGSWDKDPTWIGNSCGRMGTTAMCLLTLEVYYRHLPTYRRGTGGLKELDGK